MDTALFESIVVVEPDVQKDKNDLLDTLFDGMEVVIAEPAPARATSPEDVTRL